MKNFPWLEAAVFIALAVALIVKPQKQDPAPAQESASHSPFSLALGQ